jgi:hypothetical protein
MLLWALKRAATVQWDVPSANEHNSVTTWDVALHLLDLEHERGYMRAVEERAAVGDESCCWDEELVRPDLVTRNKADLRRYYFLCKNPLAQ